MKISRAASYAIGSLVQLVDSEPGVPVPCSKLASEGQMPERFLLQVLRNLVNHGLLKSTRGVEGGYSLAKAPTEISMLDVVEAIDGPLSVGLPKTKALSQHAERRIADVFKDVNADVAERLSQVTICDLCKPSNLGLCSTSVKFAGASASVVGR